MDGLQDIENVRIESDRSLEAGISLDDLWRLDLNKLERGRDPLVALAAHCEMLSSLLDLPMQST